MKALLGMAAAIALIAPVQASPVRTPANTGSIILVADGCGPGYYRNDYGYCRPNGPPPGYYYDRPSVRWVCPPGWHFGGGRCWPN
jgi:hypothetical protein